MTEYMPLRCSQDCKHCETPATVGHPLRRRTLSNGSFQYVYQCLTCGRSIGTAIAKAKIRNPDSLRDFDESIEGRYSAVEAEGRKQEHEAWLLEHDSYLRTPAWRERRRLVLERANGMCEGCRSVKATQVHHLTYEHWKRELLWELVAVCDACHELAHSKDGE